MEEGGGDGGDGGRGGEADEKLDGGREGVGVVDVMDGWASGGGEGILVHDSYIAYDVMGSDHCPVGLVLKMGVDE